MAAGIWDADQVFREWNPAKPCRSGTRSRKRNAAIAAEVLILDMFPVSIRRGDAVGHPEGYMRGYSWRVKAGAGFMCCTRWAGRVGLAGEKYAMKNRAASAQDDRETWRVQASRSIARIQYDWSEKYDTTDPEYFKWFAWISEAYKSWFTIADEQSGIVRDVVYRQS